ncbi:hypothetical protein [Streptomyces sp. NPDC050546]|uniref:hypothetical protein n=1 Tax=Streptomyces sp. NPDC050546 TaxID=3365628 RepID=UPI0037AE0CB9
MLTSEDVDDAFDDEAFMEERFSDVQRLLLGHDPAPGPETLVLLPAARCRLTVGPHASGPFGRCFAVRLEPRADLSAACVELLLADDGSLLGLVDAGALDGWRGAIPAGLAARYLAPPAPATLGLFGTGEAAWSCLLVLHHALPSLSEVHVVGREPDRARDFATAAALRTGLRVRVSEDVRTTAARADVVATTSGHPPVRAAWLAAGALLIDQTATVAPTVPGDPRNPVTGARAFDTDADTALRAWPSGIRPGVWSSGGGPDVGSSRSGQGAQPPGSGPDAGPPGSGPAAPSPDAASVAPDPAVRHVSIAAPVGRSAGTRQAPLPLAEIVAGRALPRRSGSDIVHYQGGELAGWSVIAAVAGLGHAWRRDVGIPVRLGRGGP